MRSFSRWRRVPFADGGILLAPEQPEAPPPSNPWQTLALVVTAVAAVFSVFTQAKGNPAFAWSLFAVVALGVAVLLYRPVAEFGRARILRARRNRIAGRFWPEFLRLEERFGAFVNPEDSNNLRNIFQEICGRNQVEVDKLCAPDYLKDFYALASGRHELRGFTDEAGFSFALHELHTMVRSYNSDYVLAPLGKLKTEQRLAQMPPQYREHYAGAIEDFRERWVRFLEDFREFLERVNGDLPYDDPRKAVGTYFERPKKL